MPLSAAAVHADTKILTDGQLNPGWLTPEVVLAQALGSIGGDRSQEDALRRRSVFARPQTSAVSTFSILLTMLSALPELRGVRRPAMTAPPPLRFLLPTAGQIDGRHPWARAPAGRGIGSCPTR